MGSNPIASTFAQKTFILFPKFWVFFRQIHFNKMVQIQCQYHIIAPWVLQNKGAQLDNSYDCQMFFAYISKADYYPTV